MQIQTEPSQRAHVLRLWCVVLTLAACDTWLNFEALPGINWGLSTLATAAAALLFLRAGGKPIELAVLSWLMLACLAALGAAVTADPAEDVVIALIVIGALAAALLSATEHAGASDRAAMVALAVPRAAIVTLVEAGERLGQATRIICADQFIPLVRGVAIAAPVSMLLALLLSAADPNLAHWRQQLLMLLQRLSFISRALSFLGFATLMLGAYGLALKQAHGEAQPDVAPEPRRGRLTDTERLIVLRSVAALFALYFVLQISYLFGNAGAQVGKGTTFAGAVHRGFVELNLASSFSALLLLALSRLAIPGSRERLIRWLVIAIVLQAQLLLLSAFHRVDVYEAAYGYTRLRLYVQAYAIVAFLFMILLAIELRARPQPARLARRAACLAALALIGLVGWNHAAWIATQNLRRYGQSGSIDARYLSLGLGPDAVPELIDSLPQLPPPLAASLRRCLREAYEAGTAADRVNRSWYEWSRRRQRLRRALAQLQASPEPPAATASTLAACRSST
jgi:two-component system sensor histidine kinase BaeS